MAEKIKVTFLGTGSAIPTARRNHPAIYLQFKKENILFDCGEGTQRQFRKAKLNPCKITKLFISHWHGDHTLGIPGLLQTLMLNGYKGPLEIYGPKGTKVKIKQILDVFMKWYFNQGMAFEIKVHEIASEGVIKEEDYSIECKNLDHHINDLAYSFIVNEKTRLDKGKLKKLKIPSSPLLKDLSQGKTVKIDGKKVDGKKLIYKEPSKKITIVTDTKMCEGAIKASKEADLLICESTYSINEQEIASDHYHLSSKDAATIAKKAKAKKLALVHLSQRYQMVPKKILSEAKKTFKNSFVPEDLDTIEI